MKLCNPGRVFQVVQRSAWTVWHTTYDPLYVATTMLYILRVNEYIIQVYDNKSVEKVSENVVYELLEYSGCIAKAKWHHATLIMPPTRIESGLPFVSCFDSNEIIGRTKVQFGKDI